MPTSLIVAKVTEKALTTLLHDTSLYVMDL